MTRPNYFVSGTDFCNSKNLGLNFKIDWEMDIEFDLSYQATMNKATGNIAKVAKCDAKIRELTGCQRKRTKICLNILLHGKYNRNLLESVGGSSLAQKWTYLKRPRKM